MYRLLLAVPFLVGIAVLKGLTVEIDTFHGSDARVYQLPTILQLRDALDFSDYPSAQTPLFHLVMAGWGKLVGFELWRLRLLNVLISYGAALALWRLLRRAARLDELPAFALTLAFVLSPYFLGASFTLLTDNLAILFALLALERVHRFAQDGSLGALALACLWTGAALLTRQSFVWLVAVVGFFVVRDVVRRREAGAPVLRSASADGGSRPALASAVGHARAPLVRLLAGAALLALALVPLAALAIEWNGLVPPSADPASCGLCTDRPGFGRDTLTLRTVGFTLALVGVYATAVFGPSLVRRVRMLRSPLVRGARQLGSSLVGALGALGPPLDRRLRALGPPRLLLAIAVAAGVALLLIAPLEYTPPEPGRQGDAGYLWRISDHLPTVLGSSLAFWALVPLGAAAAAVLARRAGWSSLASVYLGAFLLAALPVHLVYQKYFDPFALLAVALFARPPDFRRPADYAGIGLVCVASVAYALSFAG